MHLLGRCKACLSELTSRLSDRGASGVEVMLQAVEVVDGLLHQVAEIPSLVEKLVLVRSRLMEAQPGSYAMGYLVRKYRENGMSRAEHMACMVLVDGALVAVREARVEVGRLQRVASSGRNHPFPNASMEVEP